MSKYCYLENDENGHLVCRVNHRNYHNCDLYKAEDTVVSPQPPKENFKDIKVPPMIGGKVEFMSTPIGPNPFFKEDTDELREALLLVAELSESLEKMRRRYEKVVDSHRFCKEEKEAYALQRSREAEITLLDEMFDEHTQTCGAIMSPNERDDCNFRTIAMRRRAELTKKRGAVCIKDN